MTWLVLPLLLCLWSALVWGQALPFPGPGDRARAGGAPNNVALVGTNFGGNSTNNGINVALTLPASVAVNNTVLCGVGVFGATHTFVAGGLTKTAGTATIGTIALDQGFNATAEFLGVALYSMRVSGAGTLTLTFQPTGASGWYLKLGCAEFSGVTTTPLSTAHGTATATGTDHSTGTVSSSDVGVLMYVASELSGTNFTRTLSDTLIYKIDTGATTFTGLVQFKLFPSSTAAMCTGTLAGTMCDKTGTDSSQWKVAYALYKST